MKQGRKQPGTEVRTNKGGADRPQVQQPGQDTGTQSTRSHVPCAFSLTSVTQGQLGNEQFLRKLEHTTLWN